MLLSSNLKYLRKKAGFSQDFIAEKLGYKSFTTIQKWESGVSEPSISIVNKLCNLYNVTINDILYTDLSLPKVESKNILDKKEKKLLIEYNKLNNLGQNEAIKRVEELTEIPRYTKTSNVETIAAHADNLDKEQINLINEDIEDMKKW